MANSTKKPALALYATRTLYLPHANGVAGEYGVKLDVINKTIRGRIDVEILDVGIVIDQPGTIVFVVRNAEDKPPYQLLCKNAVQGHWTREDAK